MLPPLPSSAAAARRFLRDRLNDWGYPLAIGEVPCLLVSELVTNAIISTRAHVWLALRLIDRRLRSVVADQSGRAAVADPEAEIGDLTVRLVEELARRWGVESTADGKAVWFEVDLSTSERLRWE